MQFDQNHKKTEGSIQRNVSVSSLTTRINFIKNAENIKNIWYFLS
jgi:hypothetical protein